MVSYALLAGALVAVALLSAHVLLARTQAPAWVSNTVFFTIAVCALGAWTLVLMRLRSASPAVGPSSADFSTREAERLNLALNAANTSLWDAELVTGMVQLDERWSAMLGDEPRASQMTLRQLARITHPDDRSRVLDQQREVLSGRSAEYRVDHRVQARSGVWLWVHSRGRVVERDANGIPQRMIGTNTDISPRKRAEAAVEGQAAFLTALQKITLELLEHREIPDLLNTLLDRATSLLDASHGQILLKEGEDLVVRAGHGPASSQLVGSRMARDAAFLSWQAHDSGIPVIVQDYLAHAREHGRFAEIGLRSVAEFPIMIGGRCSGVLALGRDRSGRLFQPDEIERAALFAQMASLVLHNAGVRSAALEEAAARTVALRESEEKFRAVFDKGPVPIVLTTMPDGVIVDANTAAASLFGGELAEHRGSTTLDLNIWVDAGQRARYVALLESQGSIVGFEAWLRRRDGKVLTVLFYSSAVRIGDRTLILNSLLDITERKQADEALRLAEAKYRQIFEHSVEGLYQTTPDGRFLSANPAMSRMLGYANADELVSDRTDIGQQGYVRPERREEFKRLMAEQGTANDFQYELRRRDGATIWVSENARAVRDAEGKLAYYEGSMIDITERKLAEAAIRESEEKFRSVFDKSPIPIALAGWPGGEVIEVNPAATALMGIRELPFGTRPPMGFGVWIEPGDRDRFISLLREKGAITGFETTIRTRRGEELAVLLSGTLVQMGGEPYTLMSLLDITERKRAESRFRDLFEFAPDAILIGTRQGVITDVNRRGVELFGYSREELIGKTAEMLMAEEARPVLTERLSRYLAKPGPHPMGTSAPGLRAQSKGGRVFPIDLGLSPLRTGTVELVVAAIRETTEQERAAAQQRTLEQQLRQAQKMEALGTLAGGIAHDFNNLLTAILGHSEMALLDIPDNHPAAASLGAVRDAGLRSRELVKQILTFSRRTETMLTPMRLQPVVEDAFRLLRSTIPAMVQIQRHIDPKCPPICGDATQIHQVLMNLCTNAWHALPGTGGVIVLRLEPFRVTPEAADPGLESGQYVRLSVIDNGHGMDQSTLERIYDPFFTTKPVGKGTGLGLSMVHGIVNSHEGVIRVRSQPGHGTVFELYFPALETPVVRTFEHELEIPGGDGQRILYVDDDKLAGSAIAGMLKKLGYRVTHLLHPMEALDAFRGGPQNHDLVLTDLAMPGMPGTEFATHVLTMRPDIPVLLITGYMDGSQDEAVKKIGIREILRKPISPEGLASAVARALV